MVSLELICAVVCPNWAPRSTVRTAHEFQLNLPVSRWWQADLANLDSGKQIIGEAKPDVIFHLASHVKGAPDLEHVLPTFHSNLESTVNILTVATQSNCRRVILTGSLAEPDFENGEKFPVAPYAAAKWASSGYARMFHALYKTPGRDCSGIHGLWPCSNRSHEIASLCDAFHAPGETAQNQQWWTAGRLDLRVRCGRWLFGTCRNTGDRWFDR